MNLYCINYSDFNKLAEKISELAPQRELGVSKVSLMSLFARALGYKNANDFCFGRRRYGSKNIIALRTFTEYTNYAHGVVRLSESRIKVSGSQLVSLMAKAKGFSSAQALKVAIERDKLRTETIEQVTADAIRTAVAAFFYSDCSVSAQVREIVRQELTKTASLKRPELAEAIFSKGLDQQFFQEMGDAEENDEVIAFVLRMYGDNAYERLINERNDVHRMSFVKGILYRVQQLAWADAVSGAISGVLIDLEADLMSKNTRQKILSSPLLLTSEENEEMAKSPAQDPFYSEAFTELLDNAIYDFKYQE